MPFSRSILSLIAFLPTELEGTRVDLVAPVTVMLRQVIGYAARTWDLRVLRFAAETKAEDGDRTWATAILNKNNTYGPILLYRRQWQKEKNMQLVLDPSHTFVRMLIATFNFTTLPKCNFNPWSITMPDGMFPFVCCLIHAKFDGIKSSDDLCQF